jgi:hypothetical protein
MFQQTSELCLLPILTGFPFAGFDRDLSSMVQTAARRRRGRTAAGLATAEPAPDPPASAGALPLNCPPTRHIRVPVLVTFPTLQP